MRLLKRFCWGSGADLSAGEHEITMTATDSAGNQAAERFHITVSSYEILPEAIDDSALAGLDDAVFVDVVANDINIDPDAARTSLSITNTPVLGEASVAVSPSGCVRSNTQPTLVAQIRLAIGADDDTLEGNQHADVIHGGRGDDTIIGGPGDDTIRGNQGADTIYLGEGTDTLLGTAPEDNIIN